MSGSGRPIRSRVEVDVTRLRMADISDAELDAYLATDAWVGKAGAFGYQDGVPWIEVLEGSESNVVGLPLELLALRLLAVDESVAESRAYGQSDATKKAPVLMHTGA